MNKSYLSKKRIEDNIRRNIGNFLNIKEARIHKVSIGNIQRQNLQSSRWGGKCVIDYWQTDRNLEKFVCWIKKVEQPRKFINELSLVFQSLEKYGLHTCITKPFCHDENLGIVYIGYFDGACLFRETLKSCFSFNGALFGELVNVYYNLGKWLQQFHEVMVNKQVLSIDEVLTQIFDAFEENDYFNRFEIEVLTNELNKKNLDNNMTLPLVRTHNDFTLRNIIVTNNGFGIVDWDAMVHPMMPNSSPIWNEIVLFLTNLESMIRFSPFVTIEKIKRLKLSFLKGYSAKSSGEVMVYFNELFYIFALRRFLGIDSDRSLPQIYSRNLGTRYIKKLKNKLLSGRADIACM